MICGAVGIIAGVYLYRSITRDLPDFQSVEEYRPPAVSKVYAADGTLIAEFFRERRYPVKLADIPKVVTDSFLAAEDAHFYSHQGVDIVSIIRAAVVNFRSRSSKQGASTITQQVVKNLLLNPEKNYRRKLKEAILSYRLEKRLSKKDILEIYLNQIFFGNGAYGIDAACQVYFHKPLKSITLGEAAMLAALPKAPSNYSPLASMHRARGRQKYVLGQMVKNGFATDEEADQAYRQKITVYRASQRNVFAAPYFVTELRTRLQERWPLLDIDAAGLEIYTTVDLAATKTAEKALRAGLRTVDKRRGWRGPLVTLSGDIRGQFLKRYGDVLVQPEGEDAKEPHPAMISGVGREGIKIDLGDSTGKLDSKSLTWAQKRRAPDDKVFSKVVEGNLHVGDVIEVVANDDGTWSLDQTPDIQGAVDILDPFTGRVVVMIGGYNFGASKFNRVTQSMRQAGSSFKPIVYLAAVDGFNYNPASIVYDLPRTFRVGDQWWSPHNFDGKYKGPITLQTALEQSRNLVSADIVSRIGLTAVIKYARKLGVTSPLGKNPSLSLGSSEMTPLELTRAYGVFPAGGILADLRMVNRIVDRSGTEIFNADTQRELPFKQVIDPKSAFIMAHMMKGVIERGTGTAIKPLGYPVAGKTGTTNNCMDTWFIGFTPRWVAGVWVGFDQKKEIGHKETGGKISAPIFLDMMKGFLKQRADSDRATLIAARKADAEALGISYVEPPEVAPADFVVPEGLEKRWMMRDSGKIAPEGTSGAIPEYFVRAGGRSSTDEDASESAPQKSSGDYLESPDM